MSEVQERNKVAVRRLQEIWSDGSLDSLSDVVAPGCVHWRPDGSSFDNETYVAFISAIRAAFPDFRSTVEEMVAEGDTVATRLTFSGTQRGDLQLPGMGHVVPASGRSVSFMGIGFCRLEDGRITDHRAIGDWASMLRQLTSP